MAVRSSRTSVATAIAASAAALALLADPSAQTRDTIRVWAVGSPHDGDTPRTSNPAGLGREAQRRGYRIVVEAFPAAGFATTFRHAVAHNVPPDLLVFDNMSVMEGIQTARGSFEGVAEEPAFRQRFIEVTGAFEELLPPARGWTYLFTGSPNHDAARALALREPDCRPRFPSTRLDAEIADVASKLAAAYVGRQWDVLSANSDADRIPPNPSERTDVEAGAVAACAAWGNGRLRFVSTNVAYQAKNKIGHQRVLLVLRNTTGQWQLLSSARDPVTTGRFVQAVAANPALVVSDDSPDAPSLATLLAPPPGEFPRPSAPGERFGTFSWQPSAAKGVVAEIAEFAYKEDARLFLRMRGGQQQRAQVSAGELWTTRDVWSWRVWSISRAGDIAFSEARMFTH